MRPGEIIPAAERLPPGAPERMTVWIANTGALPASIGSHMPLSRLSAKLHCSPAPPARARLCLPAGASLRVMPGTEIEAQATWI